MTAPSVLTFIALADELNRAMAALQGIANGNVGDPMEYAVKVLEATGDAFNPTHQLSGTLANMHPVELVHKLSNALYRENRETQAEFKPVVIYRSANGNVHAMPVLEFNVNFRPVKS